MSGLPPALLAEHVPHVAALIKSALSSDMGQRKPASQMLEACQAVPGFCSTLQCIFVDGATYADDVRLLAAICAKLTVAAQWWPRRMRGLFGRGGGGGGAAAPTLTGCISAEEKTRTRAALLTQLGEPDAKLMQQLSLLIAKVSRFDWDEAWPALFETLLAALRSESTLHRCGSALTMYRCVKELSTKRLMADRTRWARTAAQLLPPVLPLWEERIAQLLARLAALCQAGTTLPSLAQLRGGADPAAAAAAVAQSLSVELAQVEREAGMCKHMTKVLYQCGRASFKAHATEPTTMRLFQAILEQRASLLRCRTALLALSAQVEALALPAAMREPFTAGGARRAYAPPPALLDTIVDHVEGILTRGAQLVRQSQEDYPVQFVPYLAAFVQHHYKVVIDVASAAAGAAAALPPPAAAAAEGARGPASFDQLTAHSLRFLASIFDCAQYRPGSVAGASASTNTDLSVFMTEERTLQLCHALLGAMLHLTADDLALWEREGEDFVHRQGSLSDKEHLRPAAETLLISLQSMPSRSELVVRCVLETARRSETAFAENTALYAASPSIEALEGDRGEVEERRAMDTIRPALARDAAYLALGILSFELHKSFDFSAWFVSTGVPLLQHSATTLTMRVLQRRVVWLLSCCCADLAPELQAPVYNSMPALLLASDFALRLTAVETLRALVDAWSFVLDAFAPSAITIINALYSVVAAAEDFDTRLQTMDLLGKVVERLEPRLMASSAGSPPGGGFPEAVASAVIGPLPSLWQSCADPSQSLLRAAILRTLLQVMIAMGSSSVYLQPLVVPLVLSATTIAPSSLASNAAPMLFLVEPGIELWLESMCAAPTYTEELHMLFPNLHMLMMRDFDHLPSAMTLIEAYVLVGGETFMRSHAELVAAIFTKVVGSVREGAVPRVTRSLETILRRFPGERAVLHLFEPVFSTMLAAVFHAAGGASAAGVGAAAPEQPTVICCYLTVLARVLLESSAYFIEFLGRQVGGPPAAAGAPQAVDRAQELLGRFAQCCCELYDRVSAGRGRSKGWRGGDGRRSLRDPTFDDGPWRRKLWMLALASLLASNK